MDLHNEAGEGTTDKIDGATSVKGRGCQNIHTCDCMLGMCLPSLMSLPACMHGGMAWQRKESNVSEN